MAKEKHAIVRTDNMSGTRDYSLMVSARYYDNDVASEIDNGNIVVLGDFDKNEREVRKVSTPKGTEKLTELALVASPELFYDETTHHGFEEFVNEAGKEITLYVFHRNDCFSVTAEAFTEVPAKGEYAVLTAGTKMGKSASKTGTVIGKIADIEKVGPDRYYVVQVEM